MNEDEGVTLGEVVRGIAALRSDVRDLSKDVVELKVSTGAQADKTRRLESIIYGALATGTAGLITAVTAVVTAR